MRMKAGTTSTCGQRCSAFDKIMISPLAARVNMSHRAPSAIHNSYVDSVRMLPDAFWQSGFPQPLRFLDYRSIY